MVTGQPQFQQVGLIATVEGIQTYLRDVDRVAKGQDKIQREMEETATTSSKSADAVVRDWNKVGRNMVLIGGVITGALAFGAKSAIDFESAFADVRKTVDEGEPGFIRLEEGVNNLARRLPLAREEIARTLAAAGQLGIQGVDNLLAFTEVVIGLGISTDLSAEQAAFALAQLFRVTGDGIDRFEILGSVIVELGNNTATTESRILDLTQRIAPFGAAAGLTTEELLAVSATILSLGITAERAGTQITRAFTLMTAAVEEGGEELRIFGQLSGLSASEFAELWRSDPIQAFEAFVLGLEREGSRSILALNELGFEGARAIEVFTAFAQAEGDLAANIKLANDEAAVNAALAEEVARRNATAASQITIAWNEIKIAFGEAGEALLPFLEIAIDALKTFIAAWELLPAPVQTMVVVFAGLVGAMILGIGTLLVLNNALGVFTVQQISAAAAARGFGISLQLAIPIVGIFLAAITALTFGLIELTDAQSKADQEAAAQANSIRERIDILRKAGEQVAINTVIEEGRLKVLFDAAEAERAAAAGTLNRIALTDSEADALVRLRDAGIDLESAFEIIASRTGESAEAQETYNAAIARAAEALNLTSDQAEIFVEALIEEEQAAADAAAATEEAANATIDYGKAADVTSAKIARLSSRALALRAAFVIVGNQIALEQGKLAGFEELVTFAIEEATNAARSQILVTRELEFRAEELADALVAEADAILGITEESLKLAAAGERIAGAFDAAVQAIETARAQLALGLLIDELRAAGGNEDALALALLLAAEAETGQQITSGIRAIADLFPEIGAAVTPDIGAGGDDLERGVALLLSLLGGQIQSSLPSFQQGGLVTGGFRGQPTLAQLHVGEFVIPADKVAALLGRDANGEGTRGDVNFTANYYELESPVRVRDDVEALRLAGTF